MVKLRAFYFTAGRIVRLFYGPLLPRKMSPVQLGKKLDGIQSRTRCRGEEETLTPLVM
jgi:hypothetical protein